MNRRQWLAAATATATASATATAAATATASPIRADDDEQPRPAPAPDAPPARRRPNPVGVSTYSFWQFRGSRLPVERCLEIAADMGFDGVEILLVQMTDTSHSALMAVKRRALALGMPLIGLSTHQGFVSPDPEERAENVKLTLRQIDVAADLGIPTMRVNTGRWRTIPNFDDFMANNGVEPPLEGHTDDEAFKWVEDAFQQLLPAAERRGVVLGLENHWGLGRTAAGVLRIVEAIDSPWLQTTLDTGNFLENSLEQIAAMANAKTPVALVQAKTYIGGGRWYALDIDYARVAEILRNADYRGWISLEFEGNADAATAVPESLAMLRSHFK